MHLRDKFACLNFNVVFNSDCTDNEDVKMAIATDASDASSEDIGAEQAEQQEGGKADLFRILRIIRLIRVVRILRFSRYNKNLQTLGRSLMKSGREIR